jgi:hypothetical protein
VKIAVQFRAGPHKERMIYREIYASKEWKKIEPLARAHIILVNEKVKTGATFGSFRNLSGVLEKLNIYYHIILEKERLKPLKFYVVHISSSSKMLKKVMELISRKIKVKNPDIFWGKFYGYPICCVKRYSAEVKRGNPRRRFILQLLELKNMGKQIPEELFYLMPTQVPCSPFCKKSLKILSIWKQTLEKADKEVAEWIANWNREEIEDEIERESVELRKL